MKLTIVHVTDPHWICKMWRYLSQEAESETRGYELLSNALKRLTTNESFKQHFGEASVLAHTGDSANFYNYHNKVPIEVQFQDIKERLLPLLESIHPSFDAKFAIPGNHDVERSIVSGKIKGVENNIFSFDPPAGLVLRKSQFASDISVLETTGYNKQIRHFRIIDNTEDSVTVEEGPFSMEVGETFDIYPDDRYKHFRNAFEGWITPFPNGIRTIPLDRGLVRFWLVNSTRRCGNERAADGTVLDSVDVGVDEMVKWENNILDTGSLDRMRIALIHHNPMPNYGAYSPRQKRDVFVDNGDFNGTLIRTNVKLVLSGHQHIGDETYVAMPNMALAADNRYAVPFVESGFLSLSAPTLLRHLTVGGVSPGFNVVEIFFADDSFIGDVKVSQYRFSLQKNGFAPDIIRYRLALQGIKGLDLTEREQQRRFKMLRGAVDWAYSRKPIEPLERVLGLKTERGIVNYLVKKYRECRELGDDNVFGFYSFSVLTPATWWANELTRVFRDGFIENYSRALERNTRRINHTPGSLHFEFTNSVYAAIEQGVIGSRKMDVASQALLRDSSTLEYEIDEWMHSALEGRRQGVIGSSVTKWDSDVEPLAPQSTERFLREVSSPAHSTRGTVTRARADWDIPETIVSDYRGRQTDRYEIARILFWPIEYFDSDYALKVIDFHESFCVPLFWLDPTRVKGRTDNPRKRIGATMIFAHEIPGRHRSGQPFCRWNTVLGEEATDNDGYQLENTGAEKLTLAERHWGIDAFPMCLKSNQEIGQGEFRALLRRPDILFAADVFALVKLGASASINRYLDSQETNVKNWLTSPNEHWQRDLFLDA